LDKSAIAIFSMQSQVSTKALSHT